MGTINVDGKSYSSKRYSLKELEDLFSGRVVVLKDVIFKNMNLVSGILVNVCSLEEKNDMRLKIINEGKDYTVWDLSPEPLLIGYQEFRL